MQGKTNVLKRLMNFKVIGVLIAMFVVISYLSFSGTYVKVNKDAHSTVAQKVYTSQSTKSKSLGSLKKNQNIYIYGKQNNWYQIKMGNKKGWIPTKNVKMGKYVAPPVKVNKDGHSTVAQKVYTSQSTKSKSLGSFSKNQNIYIYASQNGWYQVKIGSKKGWISSKNAKIGKYVPPITKVNKDAHSTVDQKVYTSQNTKGKTLGSIKKNQNIYVYASQNGWYQIGYGKTKGWIPAKNVKLGKYVAPKPPTTGKKYPDGWVAPVLKSKWNSNLTVNYQTLQNELGFNNRGVYSLPSYPGVISVIGQGSSSSNEVGIKFMGWTDPALKYSYRIPVVAKEVFKLYFAGDANRVWNYFNSNDIPEQFTANGRNVTASFSPADGSIILYVAKKK